ncbi:MAG: hypothetical protein M5U14_04635 [Acidimicrobiia bacterium]|nr:hypothetical protein [Acidimicrobiia bacterium]
MERTPLTVALEGATPASDLGVEVAGHYGDPAAELRALQEDAGVVDRSARGAVLVSGPDALPFLHSLVSADVAGLGDGEGAHALLLSPQGKLDVDLRLLRVGEECWLDAEVGQGPRLAGSLHRFLIRVEVEVTDRSEAWGELAVRGPAAPARVAEVTGVEPPDSPHAHVAWGDLRVVRAGSPGRTGIDVVGPVGALAGAWEALRGGGPLGGAGRSRAGPDRGRGAPPGPRPRRADDPPGSPPRAGRGVVHEGLLPRPGAGVPHRHPGAREPVPAPAARPGRCAPAGAEVVRDGRGVGVVTSVADPIESEGPAALGYVRREVEPPAEVLVRWEGGEAPAVVEAVREG